MGIRFQCPACGAKLNVKAELGGKRGACPKCQAKIQIPTADAEVDAAATVPAAAAPSAPPNAPLTTEVKWFVRPPSGGQYGPAAEIVLRQWIQEGRITPDTLVWREGDPEWKPASAYFSEMSGGPAPLSMAAPSQRAMTPAIGPVATPNAPTPKGAGELDAASAATAMLIARRKRARSTGLLMMGILIVLVLVLLPILIYVLTNQNQTPPASEPSGRLPGVHSIEPEPRWT
jgi:hypothetical protein